MSCLSLCCMRTANSASGDVRCVISHTARHMQLPDGAVWELQYRPGPSAAWQRSAPSSTHTITIQNLEPATWYHLRARGGYVPEDADEPIEFFQPSVVVKYKTPGNAPKPKAKEAEESVEPEAAPVRFCSLSAELTFTVSFVHSCVTLED